MVEFRPLLISFLLIGLFAVAMINVVYFMQIDNGATETVMDSQYGLDIYKQNVTSNIDEAYIKSDQADNSTSSSAVSFSLGSPFLTAISGVWKTLKVAPISIYQLTIGLAQKYFLSGPEALIITTTLATILTITIIFGVWKMISTGDSG